MYHKIVPLYDKVDSLLVATTMTRATVLCRPVVSLILMTALSWQYTEDISNLCRHMYLYPGNICTSQS